MHKNPGPIRTSTVPRAQLASKLTHSREFRTSDWLAAGRAQWQNLPGDHICARTVPVCSRHPHVEKGVCCRPCRQQGAMGSDLVDGRRVEAHFGVVAVVCEEVVPEVEQLLRSEHGTARHTILPPCNMRAEHYGPETYSMHYFVQRTSCTMPAGYCIPPCNASCQPCSKCKMQQAA